MHKTGQTPDFYLRLLGLCIVIYAVIRLWKLRRELSD